MSSFTIRVELHNAKWQNYADLATDLARVGITDVITAGDGASYKMSPAEYNYEGHGSIDVVLNAVRDAADRTGKTNAVFGTEAVRHMWIGLQPVQTRRSA